jgi:TRAP transporter TAXI family solute receptor
MRTRLVAAPAVTLLALLAWAGPAHAQSQRSVSIGTNPPGTVFYALASGIAKVVSGASPFQAAVQPYTGTSTLLPLANNGELDFAVVNGVDMGLAYAGPKLKAFGKNPFPHSPHVRLVMRGAPLLTGLLVRKDSPYKTIHDLKGKRMIGEYPAHLAVWLNMSAFLASAGMTWDDVKVVAVPAVNEGVDALVQGRADIAMHALNSAKIREADASVGVRHISFDCSTEGEARFRKAVPGYFVRRMKAGSAVAMVEEACVNEYDIYLLSHKNATEQVITPFLKAVWDNIDKLPPFHPVFKEWTRERAVSPEVTMPYHPVAVQFYKERGLWTPQMDEVQRRLLALNP